MTGKGLGAIRGPYLFLPERYGRTCRGFAHLPSQSNCNGQEARHIARCGTFATGAARHRPCGGALDKGQPRGRLGIRSSRACGRTCKERSAESRFTQHEAALLLVRECSYLPAKLPKLHVVTIDQLLSTFLGRTIVLT